MSCPTCENLMSQIGAPWRWCSQCGTLVGAGDYLNGTHVNAPAIVAQRDVLWETLEALKSTEDENKDG